jgi:hypothetical protein
VNVRKSTLLGRPSKRRFVLRERGRGVQRAVVFGFRRKVEF